ncbi:MAG TPA: 7TM diverse intracellular signaling domain-containing protein [Oligoflexus sp.]|uniref:7TM diverse intracellular signaling domain-containing protein n=1 Tax=Oligoflexus sp. TaxID=1971216 RepID=UPI002D362B5D|nr:7TM diverse intracellular signaling domain-containing protein [Oligoflexus sp.]HYX36700.1 7TM diverse intracellular signaling domain-containing protein [Oligoflexus sp.]
MPLLALILFLFVSTADHRAYAFHPIVFPNGADHIHVSRFHALDNRIARWDSAAILSGQHDESFMLYEKYGTMLGYPKDPKAGDFWVRVEVENQADQDISLLSDYGSTPSISRVFIQNADTRVLFRTITLDDKLRRTIKLYSLPPGRWQVYLEIAPDEFSMPIVNLDLKSTQGLWRYSPERHFLTASYGICLALIAYNFVLALTLRHRAHVIYIAYTIALLLYYEGRYQVLAEQFGIPEIPKWALVSINASSSYLFLTFLYHMADVKKSLPAWKWPLFIMFAFWPAMVVYSFIDITATQIMLLRLLTLSVPLTTAIGIHAVIKKVPGARLLVISSILPGLGTLIHFNASFFGQWLPMPFVICAQLLALDIEMILLSMTIGFKINREQEWLRKKMYHAYTELKAVVYPHQLAQIWEGMPLGKTMPVGEQNAFMIVFDVVASSKMKMADPRAFLSGVFHECSNLMMQNYQPEPLIANGYRVKEMGDGFLCSVGFPFGCPIENAADHSVNLAHQFLEIFQRHVAAVGSEHSIHCSIGIAYGPVEAFYPESGAQVYDLFGRGIILAHRYESMRDILFRWLKQRDDIIILHQPVFERLSDALRRDFVEVDLSLSDFKVRDDEQAQRLYYQLASGREQRHLLRGA